MLELGAMHEWIVISAAGALGGMAATVFSQRESVQVTDPMPWAKRIPLILTWVYNLLLNALAGALGSFLLWATYTNSLTFESVKFTPSEVAASITVGLSGVGTVRSLMRETQEARQWQQTAQDSAAALELVDTESAETDNETGGADNGQE